MSKFFNIYLKLITILLCQQVLTTNAAKTRIIGGMRTEIYGQNYIISLREPSGKFICGGTLVNNYFVVTAAHCVFGLRTSDVNVHGGVTYLSQVGEQRYVERISIPQEYNNKNYHMDVAVLKLSTPMDGPYVSTIGLCAHELVNGDSVVVSGWGRTVENILAPSNQLMTTTIRMTSFADCALKYQSVNPLSYTMMCATEPHARDVCNGDSGGPLIHNGELCGIVSFGVGCAKGHPGVYTNVNQVKDFIYRSMY